jgi:hypothetical protein
MVNLADIVTFVYGIVGFTIGWLWGRHRSNAASFMASVLIGAAGFAAGKALEWVQILTESWIDKLGQSYKFLGASAGLLANIIWFVVIVAIPIIAIAAFRKSDRRPDAYR